MAGVGRYDGYTSRALLRVKLVSRYAFTRPISLLLISRSEGTASLDNLNIVAVDSWPLSAYKPAPLLYQDNTPGAIMQVTNVKVYPRVEGTLRAYADITIDNSLSLRKLRLFRNTGGYVLCLPNVKQTDGSFRELAYPAETLKLIQDAVVAEYKKVTGPRTRSRRRVWLPN